MIDRAEWDQLLPTADRMAKLAHAVDLGSCLVPGTSGYLDLCHKKVAGFLTRIPEGFTSAEPDHSGTWVFVKASNEATHPVSELTQPVTKALGLTPAWWSDPIGGPTPLASALAGGLLGAGGGYLTGRIAENFLPSGVLQPGKLRRNMAMLGGGLGVLPSIYLARLGAPQHGSVWNSLTEPNVLLNGSEKQAIQTTMQKVAQMGDSGSMFMPSIPVDDFNQIVFRDPFLAPSMAYAASGIVQSANASQGSPGIISPYDIARVAVGMGAGLTQAYVGGKILGAVAGLSPQAQRQLQQAGVIAGAVKAVVPGLFGMR